MQTLFDEPLSSKYARNTQAGFILAALHAGDRITPMDALARWGCFRLGARIWDLKQAGWPVQMDYMTRNGKTFAVYFLLEANNA